MSLTRGSWARFFEKLIGPLTRDDAIDEGSGGEGVWLARSSVCHCIFDFYWSNGDQVIVPKAAFLRFHFGTLSTTFTCVFWSLGVGYERITGRKSCPRRSSQAESSKEALGEHPRWPWGAGQVQLGHRLHYRPRERHRGVLPQSRHDEGAIT